jgi:6-phosphogluconolactonase
MELKNSNETFYLLVGGYTGDKKRGVLLYQFNTQPIKLTYIGQSADIDNPSYCCIDSIGRFIYAVSEIEECMAVYAYAFERETEEITFINKQLADGAASCYVYVSKANNNVFVSNYKSGSLGVFPVNNDGSILPIVQQIQDNGSSLNPERQEGPHIHAAILSPDEKHLLFTDLGTDKIYSYQYGQQIPLLLHSVTELRSGSGPRHMAFSKDCRYLYVVTE